MTTADGGFRYAVGSMVCLAAWPMCVLVEIPADDPRVDSLVGLLRDSSIEAIVDFLSHDGVMHTPSFAAMMVGDGSVRVVVHGGVRAVVDGSVVEAPQFFTETTVSLGQKVSLRGGTGEARLPIAHGVVLASNVEWSVGVPTISGVGAQPSGEPPRPEVVPVVPMAVPEPVVPTAVPGPVVPTAVPEPVVPEVAAESSGSVLPKVDAPVVPEVQSPVVPEEPISDADLSAFDHLFGPFTPLAVPTPAVVPTPAAVATPAVVPTPTVVPAPVVVPTPAVESTPPPIPVPPPEPTPAPIVPTDIRRENPSLSQEIPPAEPTPIVPADIRQEIPSSSQEITPEAAIEAEAEEDIGRTQIAPSTTSLSELVEDFKQMVSTPSNVSESSVQHVPGFIDSFNWGPPSQKRSALTASTPVSMSAPIPDFPVASPAPLPVSPASPAPVEVPPTGSVNPPAIVPPILPQAPVVPSSVIPQQAGSPVGLQQAGYPASQPSADGWGTGDPALAPPAPMAQDVPPPPPPPGDFSGSGSPILPYPKPSWLTNHMQPVPTDPLQPFGPGAPQSFGPGAPQPFMPGPSFVPGVMPPGQAPVPPQPPPPFDATMRKTSLDGLSDSGDVMVVAFRCANGHFSPPYATRCRVCGIALDQAQQPLEVVRPPLGVLKLWAGGTVLLDRGVIFGRNPHIVPGTVGPMPNLLKIEDPNRDVSSQHCWVRLEDWYVTVTDLNSTNGTQVILPHRAPLALRADDPVAIEPGTRVVLANAFDFVYEVA